MAEAMLRVFFEAYEPSDLLATGYGRLVLAKAAALCLLGGVGWRQRRVNVAALQAVSTLARARRALLRLTLIEAALFGLTFGIAVGLGRTAPPPPPARLPRSPRPRSATTSTDRRR